MTLGAIVIDWEDEGKVLTNTERGNYIKSKVVHMTEVLQNEMIISQKVRYIRKLNHLSLRPYSILVYITIITYHMDG